MMRVLGIRAWLVFSLSVLAAGCAAPPAPPQTLTRDEFAALYDDHESYTDVYYMGSDAQFHHFCLEHWTVKPDLTDAKLDTQKFCQVPVDEMGVMNPFTLTSDEDQWRLLRPRTPQRPTTGPS